MKTIREVFCTKCGKKQVTDVADLLKNEIFWRVCEFCRRYGLTVITRQKASFREYLEAFYGAFGFRVVQTEAVLNEIFKDRPRR